MDKKVHEIYCNSCGKKIETTDNIKREDYLSIKKEWGYFSKKDGEIQFQHNIPHFSIAVLSVSPLLQEV